MTESDWNDYHNGYKARSKGLQPNACPFGEKRIRRRCSWLGGYVDRDNEIELRAKVKNNV